MPSASDLEMIDLDDTANPVTCRFNLSTSWGPSSQELTLDIPALDGKLPETALFFERVWAGCIANAIGRRVTLDFVEIVLWKSFPLGQVFAPIFPSGKRSGPYTSRNESGVLIMHTGHADRYARRKMFFPNMPSSFMHERVLTHTGMTALYDVAAIMYMGLNEPELFSPATWLLPYKGVVAVSPANISGVAFRRVHSVRCCSYCDDAPDEVPLDWP